MIVSEILRKKHFKNELQKDEIQFLINGLFTNTISNEQITSFLTSSMINGLTFDETAALTIAMAESGKTLNFRKFGLPVIDKHSSGGVGDKVSLLLVPILASCGVIVPMISGRGLGHTGGTIDKLESIMGYKVLYDEAGLDKLIEKNNCFIVGQSKDIAPADKILYNLRDLTGTVESIGLITASILSKKIAEGLDGLVMDIKVGSGAFMKTQQQASEMADFMIGVGDSAGLKIKIVFSEMNFPLGVCVGNWLEVLETESALMGNCADDLRKITEELAVEMLLLSGLEKFSENALNQIRKVWSDGTALNKFYSMIEQQGGNLELSKQIYAMTYSQKILSDKSGYFTEIDCRQVGIAAITIGAGRNYQKDVLDFTAGFTFNKKYNDYIEKGEEICTIYGQNTKLFKDAEFIIKNAIKLTAVKI